MRTYPFALIAARDYPTIRQLDNPYTWGGIQFCVNVSEKPYSPELEAAMKERGIDWLFCPLSEQTPEWNDWEAPLCTVVEALYGAFLDGKKMVVHCNFGNNRSRTMIEAFYYVLEGKQFEDEYKGEVNHLAYNCKIGHLPPFKETERILGNIVLTR